MRGSYIISIASLIVSCVTLLLLISRDTSGSRMGNAAMSAPVLKNSMSVPGVETNVLREIVDQAAKKIITPMVTNAIRQMRFASEPDFIRQISNSILVAQKSISGQVERTAESARQKKKTETGAKAKSQKPKTTAPEYSPVNLDGISGTKEKVDKILEQFKGAHSYQWDNQLVKQIVGLGEDAIQPLIDALNQVDRFEDGMLDHAITEALGKLLTEKHKNIILHNFQEHTYFADLIKKYRFPEAEDMVMEKIREGNLYGAGLNDDQKIIDTALMMNEAQAILVLIDYIRQGQSVEYAVEKLSAIPGLDITRPLQDASRQSGLYMWDKSQLVKPLLERGMPEGIDLAIQVLRADQKQYSYCQDKLREIVPKYTGVLGTNREMADWLAANRKLLKWNFNIRKFEMIGQ